MATYVREDLFHNLIMPMRKDSTEVSPDSCNLWLIDEGLVISPTPWPADLPDLETEIVNYMIRSR